MIGYRWTDEPQIIKLGGDVKCVCCCFCSSLFGLQKHKTQVLHFNLHTIHLKQFAITISASEICSVNMLKIAYLYAKILIAKYMDTMDFRSATLMLA